LVRDDVGPAVVDLPQTELFVPVESENQWRPAGTVDRHCQSNDLFSWTCVTEVLLETVLELRWGPPFPQPTDGRGTGSYGMVCVEGEECIRAVPVSVSHAWFRWEQHVQLDTRLEARGSKFRSSSSTSVVTGTMTMHRGLSYQNLCVQLEFRLSTTGPFASLFFERVPNDECLSPPLST
jgi:hypothetical protein